MEERLSILYQRLVALESYYHPSTSTNTLQYLPNKNPIQRIHDEIKILKLFVFKFQKVSFNYYELSLNQRAMILNTKPSHLCKSLILSNHHSLSVDEMDNERKYFCIIIQYIHKLNSEKLNDFIYNSSPTNSHLPKRKFNFQLVPESINNEITGFPHNGVCPIGLLKKMPIIVCQSCLQLSPPIIWMGGGEVDMKLGVSVIDFIHSVGALIADISEPRDLVSLSSNNNLESDD